MGLTLYRIKYIESYVLVSNLIHRAVSLMGFVLTKNNVLHLQGYIVIMI